MMIFPIPFKRQFNGPLDADTVFKTEEELNNYLTCDLRYPGMVVTCATIEGTIFVLSKDMSQWITVGNSNPTIKNPNIW